MIIKNIIIGVSLELFCAFGMGSLGMGEEPAKEKVPSLANELTPALGQTQVQPIPNSEKDAPAMDTTFWDLSSDPNGQVIWPKTNGIGKDLKNLKK